MLNHNTIEEIQSLIELLHELDEIDMLGKGFESKLKLITKIEELIDTL